MALIVLNGIITALFSTWFVQVTTATCLKKRTLLCPMVMDDKFLCKLQSLHLCKILLQYFWFIFFWKNYLYSAYKWFLIDSFSVIGTSTKYFLCSFMMGANNSSRHVNRDCVWMKICWSCTRGTHMHVSQSFKYNFYVNCLTTGCFLGCVCVCGRKDVCWIYEVKLYLLVEPVIAGRNLMPPISLYALSLQSLLTFIQSIYLCIFFSDWVNKHQC